MQVQQYGMQGSGEQTAVALWQQLPKEVAITSDVEIEQLVTLMNAQSIASTTANELALQESQKTLGVFREAIGASKAQTQVLMLENATLRERLATMENQKREIEVLYASEKKAREACAAEKIATLEETCARLVKFKELVPDLITVHKDFMSFTMPSWEYGAWEPGHPYFDMWAKYDLAAAKCEALLKK